MEMGNNLSGGGEVVLLSIVLGRVLKSESQIKKQCGCGQWIDPLRG